MKKEENVGRKKANSKSTPLSIRIEKVRKTFCDGDNHKFAEKIGTTDQHASSICTGSKPAGKRMLEKIMSAFPQLDRAWLFLGEGEMFRSEKALTSEVQPVSNTSESEVVVESAHISAGDDEGGNDNDNNASRKTHVEDLLLLLKEKDEQIKSLNQHIERLLTLLESK